MAVGPVSIGLSYQAGCCCPSEATDQTVMTVYVDHGITTIAPDETCGHCCDDFHPSDAITRYEERLEQFGCGNVEKDLIAKNAGIHLQAMNRESDFITVGQVKRLELARTQARETMTRIMRDLQRAAYAQLMSLTDADFQAVIERSQQTTPYDPEAVKRTLAPLADYAPGQLDRVMSDIADQIKRLPTRAEGIRLRTGELEKMVVSVLKQQNIAIGAADIRFDLQPGDGFLSASALFGKIFPDTEEVHTIHQRFFPPAPPVPASMVRD